MPRFTFRFPWRRTREIERDVAEELWIHLQQRIEELVDGGLSPADARRTAEQQFGDVAGTAAYCVALGRGAERVRERHRWWADLLRDLLQGWRGMRQRPAFTALAVTTLALGIGGTTAIGSVVHRLLIRPFDVPWGDRIFLLYEAQTGSRVQLYPASTTVAAWRSGSSDAFESMEGVERTEMALGSGEGGAAETVATLASSPGMLQLVGTSPLIGRWFVPEEFGQSAAKVVIIGHRLWINRFGGSSKVLQQTLSLNGEPHRIVGVLPPNVEQLPITTLRAPVWRPGLDWSAPEGRRQINVFAVLRAGVTIEQAKAQLDAVNVRLAEADERFATWKAALTPASNLLSRQTKSGMMMLLGASGLLLLLGCANVAQMLLARGIERRQEYGVRAALGASRGRLIRQALAEHLGLALLGGIAGAGLAWLLVLVGVRVLPSNLAALEGFSPGPGLLGGALLLGLATVVGFGLYPAIEAAVRLSRTGHGPVVSGARGRIGGRGRGVLLATQMMFAVVILIGAALLTRSMVRLTTLNLGFDPDGLVTWSTKIPEWRYQSPEARYALLDRIAEAVASIPGIESVARASSIPPNSGVSFGTLEIGDRTLTEQEQINFFPSLWVEPGVFTTMGSQLVDGRFFVAEAGRESAEATIVSRSLAERFWPVGGAVGKRFRVGGSEADWMTIIGVVEDVPAIGLTEMEDKPHFYRIVPRNWEASRFVARTSVDPETILRTVAARIEEVDPEIVLAQTGLVRDQILQTVDGPRFFHRLLAIFSLTALAIAATGLTGIVRHSVANRSREMAVRLALGAVPAALKRLVVAQALVPVLIGLGAGVATSWWASRLLASQLYGVSPHDTAAFGGATVVLVLVTLLAAWFPAGRVSRITPMTTLRAE